MRVGDLIWDSHYGQHGIVIEISKRGEFCTILYPDGMPDHGVRISEIEVVNESR